MLGPQYNPGLGNAHSAFFEILVGGGLLSASLYVALCVSLIWFGARLLRASSEAESVAVVGLLAVTMVFGLTSSESANAGPVGFIFWSTTALLPAMYREAVARAALDPEGLRLRNRVSPVAYARRYPPRVTF
jgi:O-antigen ligase